MMIQIGFTRFGFVSQYVILFLRPLDAIFEVVNIFILHVYPYMCMYVNGHVCPNVRMSTSTFGKSDKI